MDEAVAAQCVAEDVESHLDVVTSLVQSALGSDVVRRAATRQHWREMYVGRVQDDGTVLEGYVDLMYREDDGALVVVDYKTDAITAGALATRVAYYRPQISGYATMLTAAGATVSAASLLFLSPTSATVAPIATHRGMTSSNLGGCRPCVPCCPSSRQGAPADRDPVHPANEETLRLLTAAAPRTIPCGAHEADAIPAAALSSHVDHYKPQVEAYGQALTVAGGMVGDVALDLAAPDAAATAVPMPFARTRPGG